MYSFCAMYSFRMSFCSVPEMRLQSDALRLGNGEVHGPDDGRGRIDGHGNGHIAQRDALKQRFHIGERGNRHAALADFAQRLRIVGIVAHQRWKIERYGQPCLALCKKITVARVGLFGCSEARELAHGPQLPPVHGFVNATCIGKLAGFFKLYR